MQPYCVQILFFDYRFEDIVLKNNRSIGDISQLAKDCSIPTTRPPADSLFWEMWNQNIVQENAQATLNLSYLQGINSGLLDPNVYGGYNVADAYYCYNGADDYKVAAQKAPQASALEAFLLKKYAATNGTTPPSPAHGMWPVQRM